MLKIDPQFFGQVEGGRGQAELRLVWIGQMATARPQVHIYAASPARTVRICDWAPLGELTVWACRSKGRIKSTVGPPRLTTIRRKSRLKPLHRAAVGPARWPAIAAALNGPCPALVTDDTTVQAPSSKQQ